jgi:LysM repeat protein
MQNRMLRAAVAIAAIGLVAACAAVPPTPAASNGVAPEVAAPSPDIPKEAPVAKREARHIVVRAGQSLSRIAAEYGMPQRTIIAANDLTPPYKIKIGQQLLIPDADEPSPAPSAVGSPPPEVIPLDRPALPGSAAPPPTTATANPMQPTVVPAVKPVAVAAPAGDKSPEASPAPVAAAPTTTSAASGGSAEPPAPATTAAAPPPTPVAAAAPPGVTCPSGTMGMWSEDIIKKPVYICRKVGSQS